MPPQYGQFGSPGRSLLGALAELLDPGPDQIDDVPGPGVLREGLRALDQRAFSVQYHPEAAPGPHDARYLFGAFTRLMDGRADYLDGVD